MGIAKVTTNYQVTIPKDIRKAHGIDIGDTVFFVLEGEKIHFLKKEPAEAIDDAAGCFKSRRGGLAYEREIRKEWQ